MIVRYVPAKVFANLALAIVAGAAVVAIFAMFGWSSTIVGALSGVTLVTVLLLIGALKRAGRKAPLLTLGDAGLTVHLPGFGLIPWSQIRHWEVNGIAWIGVRLIVDYAGAERVKLGFMATFDWFVQSKRRKDGLRLVIGALDQTDASPAALKAALASYAPRARV